MNVRQLAGLALFLACLSAPACSSMNSVQNVPLHAGVARPYPADFGVVLRLAREAVLESGLRVESAYQVDESTWIIMAKAPTSWWSMGEMVRVTVERGARETTVRVYTRRKLATNVAAKGDYANTILSNLELKLRSA